MVADDQAKKAITYLRDSVNERSNLQNELIALNARLARLTRRENGGLITESRAEMERNRINAAIQSLLEDIKADDLRDDAQWPD